jgi:hypothetical protein
VTLGGRARATRAAPLVPPGVDRGRTNHRALVGVCRSTPAHHVELPSHARRAPMGTLKMRATTLTGWRCHTWSHPGGLRHSSCCLKLKDDLE